MKRFINLLALSLLASLSGFAQMSSDYNTAALVNSEPVNVRDLRVECELREKLVGRALTAEEREQVLNEMVDERLILQAAARDRINADTEVNNLIQELRSQMAQQLGRQPTETEFNTAVRNNTGMGLEDYRKLLQRQVLGQKYILSKKPNLSVPPTAEAIIDHYNKSKSRLTRPEMVSFLGILIRKGSDNSARTKAEQLDRKIAGNADMFDQELLRLQLERTREFELGSDTVTLNEQGEAKMGRNFMNIVFGSAVSGQPALEEGRVSRLIEGSDWYMIIKIAKREPYKSPLALSDEVVVNGSRMSVQTFLITELQQAAYEQALRDVAADLRRSNSVRIFREYLNW